MTPEVDVRAVGRAAERPHVDLDRGTVVIGAGPPAPGGIGP